MKIHIRDVEGLIEALEEISGMKYQHPIGAPPSELFDASAYQTADGQNDRQNEFDLMISRLERSLSEMVYTGKDPTLDKFTRQTLKLRARDLIFAGRKILKDNNWPEPQ